MRDASPHLVAEIESTCAELLAFTREHGVAISADLRVSERDAAKMLGIAPTYLKALRLAGNGPSFFAVGVAGSRYSYRLRDIASWIAMSCSVTQRQ